MRALQMVLGMAALIGLLSACAYHKYEYGDGHGHDHDYEVEIDD